MADIQGGLSRFGGAPNILGAITTGAGIAQRNQQLALQQREFDRQTQQLAIENARKEEERQVAASELEYKKANRELEVYTKLGNVEKQKESYRKIIRTLTDKDLPLEYPIEQEDLDLARKIHAEKDPDKREIMEDILVERTGKTLSVVSQEAEGLGLPTGMAAREKLEAEERAQARKLELEEAKTAGGIEKEQARITATAAAAKEATIAEQERIKALLDQAGLDEKTKNKILIAMQGGVGAPAEAALFPKSAGENITYVEKTDPITGDPIRIPAKTYTDPKTGKFMFQVAEEFVPKQEVEAKKQAAVKVSKKKDNVKTILSSIDISKTKFGKEFLDDFEKNNPGVLDRELTDNEFKSILELFKKAARTRSPVSRAPKAAERAKKKEEFEEVTRPLKTGQLGIE